MLPGGSYPDLVERKNQILEAATGIAYGQLEQSAVVFDYEGLMQQYRVDLLANESSLGANGVGQTPLIELKNLTRLVRKLAPPGRGARIFLKDEASNPAGSPTDRPAAMSAAYARRVGFSGVVAVSGGSYGVSLASQAAVHNLRAIIVQETADSQGRTTTETQGAAQACEALGAEVLQTSSGSQLFHLLLQTLEDTQFFFASLHTPMAVAGHEVLGLEIAQQVREQTGQDPDGVLATLTGGDCLTGLARGLRTAGAYKTRVMGTRVVWADLWPELCRVTWPEDGELARSAARPLRYLDDLFSITPGDVIYATHALAYLEGLERGAARNGSLAVAISLAREMRADQILVVAEAERTGPVPNPAHLGLTGEAPVGAVVGNPADYQPGGPVVIPAHPALLWAVPVNLDMLRRAYVERAVAGVDRRTIGGAEILFLAEETNSSPDWVSMVLAM